MAIPDKHRWMLEFAMDLVIAMVVGLCLNKWILDAGHGAGIFVIACVVFLSPIPVVGAAIRRQIGMRLHQKRPLPR